MNKLFRTAYFFALSGRPFTDYPKIIELKILMALNWEKHIKMTMLQKIFFPR